MQPEPDTPFAALSRTPFTELHELAVCEYAASESVAHGEREERPPLSKKLIGAATGAGCLGALLANRKGPQSWGPLLVGAGLALLQSHLGHKNRHRRKRRPLSRQLTRKELHPLHEYERLHSSEAGAYIPAPSQARHPPERDSLDEPAGTLRPQSPNSNAAQAAGSPAPRGQPQPTPLALSTIAIAAQAALITVVLLHSLWRWQLDIVALMLVLAALVGAQDHAALLLLREACAGSRVVQAVQAVSAALPSVRAPGAPRVQKPNPLLTGSWIKDASRSDAMDEACDVLQLSGIIRKATKLFKGMEIRLSTTRFEMSAFSVIPFLKASPERYAYDGSVSCYNRRDMREGKHRGYLQVEADGNVTVFFSWDAPLAGHSCDEVKLAGPDELHVTTHLHVGSRSTSYTVVYTRARK